MDQHPGDPMGTTIANYDEIQPLSIMKDRRDAVHYGHSAVQRGATSRSGVPLDIPPMLLTRADEVIE